MPPELAAIPEYPRLLSEAFIDCLVRLHAIDVRQPDIAALGKPGEVTLASFAERLGFRIEEHSLVLYGRCQRRNCPGRKPARAKLVS